MRFFEANYERKVTGSCLFLSRIDVTASLHREKIRSHTDERRYFLSAPLISYKRPLNDLLSINNLIISFFF
jgi:hypothetical protein